jgi:DNA modification methylase
MSVELIHGDCLEKLKDIPDNSIDLVVTSPPYDNLRTYEGSLEWSFDIFKPIAKELARVIKKGGVIVWVVGDATIKGSETGSSFKQALYFKEECGLNLHDTMIYAKGGQGATGSNLAYWQDFEYMFVFSKGKIVTFNPIEDRKNKVAPRTKLESQGHRHSDGTVKSKRVITRKEYGKRFNIWTMHESGTRNPHPAVFPEQLAHDHIISWSNKGDTVLDPFMGSGTTGKMAVLTDRKFIGIDKVEEYVEIAKKRIEEVTK